MHIMTYSISNHDREYRRIIRKIKKYQKEIDKAIREDNEYKESIINFRRIQINDLIIEKRRIIDQRLGQQ